MSIHENGLLVRQLFEEVWNRGNDAALQDLLTSGSPPPTKLRLGPDTAHLRAVIMMLRRALPDWQVTIETLVAMPDRVLTRWSAAGTHRGPFLGRAPTGQQVTASGISIFYVVDGRIHDARVSHDSLTMLQQVCRALIG